MSEREIRSVLQHVMEELDRHARKIVYPSILGAGIALSGGGCGDGRPVQVDTIARPDSAYGAPDRGPQPVYSAPDDMRPREDRRVPGPDAAYMAPDLRKRDSGPQPWPDGGPIPPYMAPEAGPIPPIDGGMQPLYIAPWPDGGPIPPYMAPEAGPVPPTDAGPVPPWPKTDK